MRCGSCGQENPAGFRFCGHCGAPVTEAAPAREVRKVVTVVFCDLSGSTALGEARADLERALQLWQRYGHIAQADRTRALLADPT